MTAKPLDLEQFEGHTPGPWKAQPLAGSDGPHVPGCYKVMHSGTRQWVASQTTPRDAALLAAAPALLAECRRQRAEVKALREALADMLNAHSVQPIVGAIQHYASNRAAVQETSQARTKARAALAKVSP